MSAQRFIDRIHGAGGVITSFHSLCGGLPSPAANTNPLGYKLSWSPRGVLLASRNTATYLAHGEVRSVGGEQLYVEGVGYHTEAIVDTGAKQVGRLELEWYPNRDSTVYGDIYGIREAHTLIRGTYRNAGWCAMMRMLSRHGFTETDAGRADRQWRRTTEADGALNLAQFTYCVLTDTADRLPSELADETRMRRWVKQRLSAGGVDGVSGKSGVAGASRVSGSTAAGHGNGHANGQVNGHTSSSSTATAASAASAFASDDDESASIDNVLDRLSFLGLLSSTTTLPASCVSRLPCSLDVVCELFERHLQYSAAEEDMVVMKHTFEVSWPGRGRSHREQHTCTLIDTGAVHGVAGQYSSMARTVSQPVAICIRALLDGRWAHKPELTGVLRPVQPLVYNTVLDEMAGLGVVFSEERAPLTLWVRSESKAGEHRVALTPQHARRLMEEASHAQPGGSGLSVVVERSPHRCIPDAVYAAAGCRLVREHSWKEDAPDSAIILGLKELPDNDDSPLHHRHVFFAHCYKQQQGWDAVLRRFVAGQQLGDVDSTTTTATNTSTAPTTASTTTSSSQPPVVKGVGSGLLWDLEFLVDQQGRRVAAFGRAAGLVGMALGLLQWCCQRSGRRLRTPLQPFSSIQHMLDTVRQELEYVTHLPVAELERVRAGGAAAADGSGVAGAVSSSGGERGASPYTTAAGHHSHAAAVTGTGSTAPFSSLFATTSTTNTTTSAASGSTTSVISGRSLPLPSVLVLGALGRCGAGCVWVCRQLGLPSIAEWDLEQTRGGGPFPALASEYDVVVNSIYLSPHVTIPPFLTQQLLDEAEGSGVRRVSVVVDVSCDTSNPNHPLPFYSQGTTLSSPVLPVPVAGGAKAAARPLPLDVIAIDHLPALIPTESSDDFSAALSPHLAALSRLHQQPPHASEYIWNKAEQLFEEKVNTLPATSKQAARVAA